jgi:hypothetical protein
MLKEEILGDFSDYKNFNTKGGIMCMDEAPLIVLLVGKLTL